MSRLTRVLAIAALLSALCAPAIALAATTAPSYGVQAWAAGDPANPGHVLFIGSVTLPTSTPLPAVVSIPLPEGVEITWAGEILGPDGTGDITREGKVTAGTGGKSYTFTMEQSRDGQIEGLWEPLEKRDGPALGAKLEWVQTVPAEMVSFSVRTPAGAEQIRIEPPSNDAPQENGAGERLYTLSSKGLKPGESHTIDVSYVPAGSAGASGPAEFNTVLMAVLGGAVVMLVVAIVWLVRRERAASESRG